MSLIERIERRFMQSSLSDAKRIFIASSAICASSVSTMSSALCHGTLTLSIECKRQMSNQTNARVKRTSENRNKIEIENNIEKCGETRSHKNKNKY